MLSISSNASRRIIVSSTDHFNPSTRASRALVLPTFSDHLLAHLCFDEELGLTVLGFVSLLTWDLVVFFFVELLVRCHFNHNFNIMLQVSRNFSISMINLLK